MAEEVTQLLAALSEGQDSAVDRLMPILYEELRGLAESFLRAERSNHTLQTTALVHEAYLKLTDQRFRQWKDRAHFFAIAAQAMRRILVDHARAKKRQKRGGQLTCARLEVQAGLTISSEPNGNDLIVLDEALAKLSKIQPQAGRVVEMRYFGGLATDDIALAMGVSDRTIEREWRYARAWLFKELAGDETPTRELSHDSASSDARHHAHPRTGKGTANGESA